MISHWFFAISVSHAHCSLSYTSSAFHPLLSISQGSDVTLIPVSIINKLNPPRIGRAKKTVTKPQGLGGLEIGIVPYRIKLSFSDRNLMAVKIWSCLDEYLGGNVTQNLIGDIILGRNFLNRHKITFDGINNLLIVDCPYQ